MGVWRTLITNSSQVFKTVVFCRKVPKNTFENKRKLSGTDCSEKCNKFVTPEQQILDA